VRYLYAFLQKHPVLRNIRLQPRERGWLECLVENANAKAREAGLPDEITSASLIRMWIRERAREIDLTGRFLDHGQLLPPDDPANHRRTGGAGRSRT
jgi:hypothetical protein